MSLCVVRGAVGRWHIVSRRLEGGRTILDARMTLRDRLRRAVGGQAGRNHGVRMPGFNSRPQWPRPGPPASAVFRTPERPNTHK